MDTFRKWLNKPKADDKSLLARFYHADRALTAVASELDSFDGRAEPDRCSRLVSRLRQGQDKVLSITNRIMEELLGEDRAPRAFRAKFPEEVLQENLAGQLWFGAECLAAGSSIMNRELESTAMRPLAQAVTKSLDNVRNLLRDQCLRNNIPNSPTLKLDINDSTTEQLYESLKIFDRLFAEFELRYVSAMVQVKSKHEYEMQELICVLFSETLQRALTIGLLEQEQVDSFDPALMFSIPRLAIITGLVIYYKGPLNMDMPADQLSEMFRPFRTILIKIRDLLRALNKNELYQLEKLLCTNEEIHLKNISNTISQTDNFVVEKQNLKTLENPDNDVEILKNDCDDELVNNVVDKHKNSNSNDAKTETPIKNLNENTAMTDVLQKNIRFPEDKNINRISKIENDHNDDNNIVRDLAGTSPTNSISSATSSATTADVSSDWTDEENNSCKILNDDPSNLVTDYCATGFLIPNTNFGNLLQANDDPLTDNFIASDDEFAGNCSTTTSSDNIKNNNHFAEEISATERKLDDPRITLNKNLNCTPPTKKDTPKFSVSNHSSNGQPSCSRMDITDSSDESEISRTIKPTQSSSTSTTTANSIENKKNSYCDTSKSSTTTGVISTRRNSNKNGSQRIYNHSTNSSNHHLSSSSSNSNSSSKNSTADREHRHHSKKQRSKHHHNNHHLVDSTSSGDTSSLSDVDPHEVHLAVRAAGRMKFKSTENLLHRLFVCIAGVADQLQTNFASDLRQILRSVFLMNTTPVQEEIKIPEKSKDSSDLFEFRPSENDVIQENNGGSNQSIYSAAEEVNPELDNVFADRSATTQLTESSNNSSQNHQHQTQRGNSLDSSNTVISTRQTIISRNGIGRSRSLGEEQENEQNTRKLQLLQERRRLSSQGSNSAGSESPINSSASSSPVGERSIRTQGSTINYCQDTASVPVATSVSIQQQSSSPINVIRTNRSAGVTSQLSSNRQNQNRRHFNHNRNNNNNNNSNSLPKPSPPAWIPDEDAPRCMACTIPFTAFRRRHHCRNCGGVFCGGCSNSSAPLPKYGLTKAVRVCRDCYVREVGT